jgi:hypothetical protein
MPSTPDYLRRDERPKLFVAAEHDQFCDLPVLRNEYQTWAEPKTLVVLEGTDHFLGIGPSSNDARGCAYEIASAVVPWLRTRQSD